MLTGRLGLETARLPHGDRHGLVLLDRGRLSVEEGCLTFECAGGGMTPTGRYGLPHQSVSLILLEPGSSVSHDALRLLARHNCGLAAIGEDGVRCYTAMPLLPDFSHLARARAASGPTSAAAGRWSHGACTRCVSSRCCRTGTSRSCGASRARG